jgi:hypothetical protein
MLRGTHCFFKIIFMHQTTCIKLLDTSQIYRLHGFISNPCEICYFIGSYCLNMNVMHYLNMEVMCMIFVCK